MLSVVRQSSIISKIFSETKVNFMWSTRREGGIRSCINYLGHVTKMAAVAENNKKPSKIF